MEATEIQQGGHDVQINHVPMAQKNNETHQVNTCI